MLVAGLNWHDQCEKPLALWLLIYGLLGIVFVFTLSPHFCYYGELGAWPARSTACWLLLLLLGIGGMGMTLVVQTVR